MSDATKIEWADATLNVLHGCSRVGAGCEHCYAVRHVHRMASNPNPKIRARCEGLVAEDQTSLNWTGKVRCHPEMLEAPLKWKTPRRIFVPSLGDLFHDEVPDTFIADVFSMMARADWHQYIVLTKRPVRMGQWINRARSSVIGAKTWPLPNVILGVSAWDQESLERMVPPLLATPAACRAISLEPLLGPVDLDLPRCETHDREFIGYGDDGEFCNECAADGYSGDMLVGHWLNPLNDGIGWVIVGAETGSGARPCDVAWIEKVVKQCRDRDRTPCFVKKVRIDGRISSDPSEWPESIRMRQWPEIGGAE